MQSGCGKRFWLTLALGTGVGTLIFAILIAYVVHQGSIQVQVREGGPGGAHFSLVVPVVLLDLGLKFVPNALAGEMDSQAREHLYLAQAVCRSLERSPDCILVQVEAPGEMLRIAKHGGKLQILVEEGGDRVKVSLPLKSIAKLLDELAP